MPQWLAPLHQPLWLPLSPSESTLHSGTAEDEEGLEVKTGVDETGVDETGVDETGVDETGVDDIGVADEVGVVTGRIE